MRATDLCSRVLRHSQRKRARPYFVRSLWCVLERDQRIAGNSQIRSSFTVTGLSATVAHQKLCWNPGISESAFVSEVDSETGQFLGGGECEVLRFVQIFNG